MKPSATRFYRFLLLGLSRDIHPWAVSKDVCLAASKTPAVVRLLREGRLVSQAMKPGSSEATGLGVLVSADLCEAVVVSDQNWSLNLLSAM